MFSSMNVHGVQSIRAKTEKLECRGEVSSTTKLVIKDAEGYEFTVTCFSDQPVTVEIAAPTPVAEEAV